MTIQKSKAGRPRNTKRLTGEIGEYTLKNTNRFWSKVNKHGPVPEQNPELGACWEWMGGSNGTGYGQVRINYRQMNVHQVAWELLNGEIPAGLWVLRRCENRRCVNPAHLYLGEPKDSASGRLRKGFSTGTVRHHLTRHEVLELKNRHAAGESMIDLARAFDVSYTTVKNIIHGRTRKLKK